MFKHTRCVTSECTYVRRKHIISISCKLLEKIRQINCVPGSSHSHRYRQVTSRRHNLVMMFDVDAVYTEYHRRQATTPTAAAAAVAANDVDDAADIGLRLQLQSARRPICR